MLEGRRLGRQSGYSISIYIYVDGPLRPQLRLSAPTWFFTSNELEQA